VGGLVRSPPRENRKRIGREYGGQDSNKRRRKRESGKMQHKTRIIPQILGEFEQCEEP